MKGFLLSILVLCSLLVFSPLAGAQTKPSIPPELVASLQHEAPLTQTDVDTFIRIMPEVVAAGNSARPSQAAEVFKAAGMTDSRAVFVTVKIAFGAALAKGIPIDKLDKNKELPEILYPTEADLVLMKKNKQALENLYKVVGPNL